MYEEVKTCVEAEARAAEERRAAIAANLVIGHSRDLADCPMCNASDRADRAYREAVDPSWEGLKASTDPLVRWIAGNVKDHKYAALEVLKLLPASMAELDALAERQGWCPVYRRLRDRAAVAGVLPSEDSEVSA